MRLLPLRSSILSHPYHRLKIDLADKETFGMAWIPNVGPQTRALLTQKIVADVKRATGGELRS
jgi:hypothetical protein